MTCFREAGRSPKGNSGGAAEMTAQVGELVKHLYGHSLYKVGQYEQFAKRLPQEMFEGTKCPFLPTCVLTLK